MLLLSQSITCFGIVMKTEHNFLNILFQTKVMRNITVKHIRYYINVVLLSSSVLVPMFQSINKVMFI